MRPTLCEEALRLGRILAALAPRDSEVHGLCALMELQSSRLAARVAEDGSPTCCLIRIVRDGIRYTSFVAAARERAAALATEFGPYAIQAAIAACHAGLGPLRPPIG